MTDRGWKGVGRYVLLNVANGRAMDNLWGGDKVGGWESNPPYGPGGNQTWTVMDTGDGRYLFYNEKNKRFLTCGASGAQLSATGDAKTENSAWYIDAARFQKTDGKPVVIWSSTLDHNAIDLAAAGSANGTPILAYPQNGEPSPNQRWYMVAVRDI